MQWCVTPLLLQYIEGLVGDDVPVRTVALDGHDRVLRGDHLGRRPVNCGCVRRSEGDVVGVGVQLLEADDPAGAGGRRRESDREGRCSRIAKNGVVVDADRVGRAHCADRRYLLSVAGDGGKGCPCRCDISAGIPLNDAVGRICGIRDQGGLNDRNN
jgi:hypothetical protein